MHKNVILHGNALDLLPSIESESIDCIITSPPYWSLRDYSTKDQIGLENTLEEYHFKLLTVTAECKRVLKDSGTVFWVHGDSYYSGGGKANEQSAKREAGIDTGAYPSSPPASKQRSEHGKCLIMQNYRFVMRMIDEQGWILRNTLIWHKKNHMPSSVQDRFANAYEPIFFFSKSKKYFFDLDAIRVPYAPLNRWGGQKLKAKGKSEWDNSTGQIIYRDRDMQPNEKGKNPGDVITLSTQPFPEAHFATFPEKLIEPFVKAGCPEGGIILDPFMGAGTTSVVAKKQGRDYIGIEINNDYIAIAQKRLNAIPVRLDRFM